MPCCFLFICAGCWYMFHVCACVEAGGRLQYSPFLRSFPPFLVLRKGLPLMGNPPSGHDCLPTPLPIPICCFVLWRLNSHPRGCKASSLPAEPPSQPAVHSFFLHCWFCTFCIVSVTLDLVPHCICTSSSVQASKSDLV